VAAVEQVRTELGRDDLRQAFGADSTVQQVYRNAARVRLRLREAAVARDDSAAAATEAVAALRLMEQARNRALADLMTPLRGAGAPSDGDTLEDLLQAWRGAGAEAALAEDRLAAALRTDPPAPGRVADRQRDLDAARAVLAAREAELRGRDERYWRLTAGAEAQPDPASILPQLPPGHVVLVYSLDRPDFLACGVDAGGVVATHWSRDERRIGALADRLVDACRRGEPWEDLAARLAEILLAPLADALDGATTVHVVASGPTLRVPFAVLPWRDRPLGFQADVSMLPSLSAYPLLGSAGTGGPALVVGDPAAMSYRRSPDDPPQPQPPLPAAAVEATAVARVFDIRPLLGRDATEARVRAALPRVRIAHLATHGVLDPDSPRASAVLLADGEQITVAELMGMRISADLVVLSACETGTGRPAGGDEMLGLGRGLLAAGARSALVTLWPVLDASAALLMTRFHEKVAGGAPVSTALRDATCWLAELDRNTAQQRLDALRDDDLVARLPDEWTDTVRGAVADATRAISTSPEVATPYSHPRHWAPYLLLGR
jgi:CHAT domain-containing protein